MRSAALGLVLAAAACGPTESERAIARADAAIAGVNESVAQLDAIIEDAKPAPKWTRHEGKSLIDDQPEISVHTTSQKLDGPTGTQRATLMVSCTERALSIVVAWPRSLDGEGRVSALFRFDSAPASTREPSISTNDTGFGWWGRKEANPILAEILAAKRLVVRVTAYDGQQMTAEFITAGLGEHMPALEQACPS